MLKNEEMGLLQKESLFDSLKKENFELKMRIYLLTENLNLEQGQIDFIEQISQLKANLKESEITNTQLLNELQEMHSLLQHQQPDMAAVDTKITELENDNMHLANLVQQKENDIAKMAIYIKYQQDEMSKHEKYLMLENGNTLETLNEENSRLQEENSRLKEDGSDFRNVLAKEMQDLKDLHAQQVQSIQEEALKSKKELLNSREDLKNEVSSLKQQLKEKSVEILEFNTKFQDLKEENTILLRVKERNSVLITSLENRISKLKVYDFSKNTGWRRAARV